MSQQGFPNMGIMPDNSPGHNYDVFIKTEAEIKDLANELSRNAFDSNVLSESQLNLASQAEGFITAVLGLAQYYHQQTSYTGSNGIGSQSNPASPQFSNATNQHFLQSLGNNPHPSSLYHQYNHGQPGPRDAVGVQNFFFNLGMGADAFQWGDDGLSVSDVYRFTGINDFGVAPPEDLRIRALTGDVGAFFQAIPYIMAGMVGVSIGAAIFGPQALRKSGMNIINEAILNNFLPLDPTVAFDFDLYRNENNDPFSSIGALEDMYVKHTWSHQYIYENNPALFYAAVAEGYITFAHLLAMPDFICNSITVGNGVDPFGILVPNYAQTTGDITTNTSGWTFGGGGNYPRPFTSYSQRLVEATYSLGPFAVLDYKNPTDDSSLRISGRIAYLNFVCNGAPSEVGFIRQDWYNADLNGFGYGDNYLKKDWWKQAKKSKMKFRYGHLPGHPQVEVQVATASFADSAPQAYVPDINLTTTVGGTLLLAAVLFVGSRGGI